MKIGLALDNCLAKTDEAFNSWQAKLNLTATSWKDRKLVRLEDFWAAIRPYEDLLAAIDRIKQEEIHIFVERPPALFAITRAWLKKNGIMDPHIHMQSLKRYDCRLNDIDNFIDTDLDSLIPFKYERTQAILLSRSLLRYHSMKLDNEILMVPNLGTALEKCNDGKMHVPWSKVL